MIRTPAEIAGWVLAIIVVAVMGLIVALGPFHKVNKVVVAVANLPVLHVNIKTDPKTTGTYAPHVVTVKVNQEVDFTNVSDAIHTVSDNNGSFDSRDIATNGSGSTWVFRPTTPGTFHYFCKYHPLMHGVLVVTS